MLNTLIFKGNLFFRDLLNITNSLLYLRKPQLLYCRIGRFVGRLLEIVQKLFGDAKRKVVTSVKGSLAIRRKTGDPIIIRFKGLRVSVAGPGTLSFALESITKPEMTVINCCGVVGFGYNSGI